MAELRKSTKVLLRCWCCNAVYPNKHKSWCLDTKLAVAAYDKRYKKRASPKQKRVVKPRYTSKKCALCRVEVKEGAFCSDLCRSDAWRLFHREEENVRYSGSNRTRQFR